MTKSKFRRIVQMEAPWTVSTRYQVKYQVLYRESLQRSECHWLRGGLRIALSAPLSESRFRNIPKGKHPLLQTVTADPRKRKLAETSFCLALQQNWTLQIEARISVLKCWSFVQQQWKPAYPLPQIQSYYIHSIWSGGNVTAVPDEPIVVPCPQDNKKDARLMHGQYAIAARDTNQGNWTSRSNRT